MPETEANAAGSAFILSVCKTYSWTSDTVSILLKNQTTSNWITDVQPIAFNMLF